MITYLIQFPDGSQQTMNQDVYVRFRKINELDPAGMTRTLKGIQDEYKGYKIISKERTYEINDSPRRQAMLDDARTIRKEIREGNRFVGLLEMIKEEIRKKEPISVNVNPDPYDSNIDTHATLSISDAHYGEEFKTFNSEYSPAIAKARIERVCKGAIEESIKNSVNVLHFLNLGDLISGNIHITTRIENTKDIVEQVIEVSEILANCLKQMAEYIPRIEYYGTSDNHSRVTANKKDNIEEENMNRLISYYVKIRLEDTPNIYFNENKFGKGIATPVILGHKCIALHGHEGNGGINTIINRIPTFFGFIPEYVFTGHFHRKRNEDLNGIELISNPAIIKGGTYSDSLFLTSKEPYQLMEIFKKEKGIISEIRLFCN